VSACVAAASLHTERSTPHSASRLLRDCVGGCYTRLAAPHTHHPPPPTRHNHNNSEGGFFNARLTFPKDYPNSPPACRFTSDMWHPNGETGSCSVLPRVSRELVGCKSNPCGFGNHQRRACTASKRMATPPEPPPALAPMQTFNPPSLPSRSTRAAVYDDGRVCISILHQPGDDPHGYETAAERWSPVHTVRRCGRSARRMHAEHAHAPSPMRPCSSTHTHTHTHMHTHTPTPLNPPPTGRVHHPLHHLHALIPQRRVARQRRRSEAVARGPGRLQEEGVADRAQEPGDALRSSL